MTACFNAYVSCGKIGAILYILAFCCASLASPRSSKFNSRFSFLFFLGGGGWYFLRFGAIARGIDELQKLMIFTKI